MLKKATHFSARGYMRYTTAVSKLEKSEIELNGCKFQKDEFTNISPKVISYLGRDLHNAQYHPLCFIKKRIVDYFYDKFKGRTGNPSFSVYDQLNPVVTVEQNFDSLLIPKDHVSRKKSDCYYINRNYLLRAHMTCHQSEMMKAGLDNFIMFGDVYRRDEIDSTHYPVFHQSDAVRLCCKSELERLAGTEIEIFETRNIKETHEKQGVHTMDATKIMEHQLKSTLLGLAQHLFGKDTTCRWVDVYFPFTHPSWELEVYFEGRWIEVLGCGIMRHQIVASSGAEARIGWAFGLGLERLAMCLYKIPDIRLFWTRDTGFTSQFDKKSYRDNLTFKPISIYPQCTNDISFWLPTNGDSFEANDFYELVREIGGDLVEQVHLVDEFVHPKTGKKSQCYRITYRHLSKTLTQEEVNTVHSEIADKSAKSFGVVIR